MIILKNYRTLTVLIYLKSIKFRLPIHNKIGIIASPFTSNRNASRQIPIRFIDNDLILRC